MLLKTINGRAIEEYDYELRVPSGNDGLAHHFDMSTDPDTWKTRIDADEQNVLPRMARTVPKSPVIASADSDDSAVVGIRDGIDGNQEHPCPDGYINFEKFCIEAADDYQ